MDISRWEYLLNQYANGKLNFFEWEELSALAEEGTQEQWEQCILAKQVSRHPVDIPADIAHWQTVLNNIFSIDKQQKSQTPFRLVHLLSHRMRWFRYAAAVLFVIGVCAYLFINQRSKTNPQNPVLAANNIPAPETTHATITLDDGTKIRLDTATSGVLAMEENMQVTKLADGQLRYSGVGSVMQFNTLTNPRGSRVVKIILEDGTQVWLNAESSLKYPTAFVGTERKVEITGEAYFEVAKNKSKPFIVRQLSLGSNQTNTGQRDNGRKLMSGLNIVVLGTSFNVNAYANEPHIKTSLIEGSIKVNDQLLKPGDAYTNGKVIPTNTDLDIAWKNGIFNFNDITLEQAMRQLSRWYNIDVKYEKGIPHEQLFGKIDNNLTLQEVLSGLNGIVANFRLEGKTVFITPLK